MMLPTDLALRDDPQFRKYVEIYAKVTLTLTLTLTPTLIEIYTPRMSQYSLKILLTPLQNSSRTEHQVLPRSA